MRLILRLFLVSACLAAALVWADYTREPGSLFYHTEVTLRPSPGEPIPTASGTLRKGEDLLESAEFIQQAVDRLAGLQLHAARQLGPNQLVDSFEGSQTSLAAFLSHSYSVRFDEAVPALILTVSGESQSLVTAISKVVPDLFAKARRSSAAAVRDMLTGETQKVLADVELLEQALARSIWNLKGALNARFADRPISKRGTTQPPSPVGAALAGVPESVTVSLAAVRAKLSTHPGAEQPEGTSDLSPYDSNWKLLEESLLLRNHAALLIPEASSLYSALDAATSVLSGLVPEGLKNLDGALTGLRGQLDALDKRSFESQASPPQALLLDAPPFLVEWGNIEIQRIGGTSAGRHFTNWGLCGLGTGIALSLVFLRRPGPVRRRL